VSSYSPSLALRAKPARCARGSVSSAATKSGAHTRPGTASAHRPRTASAASRLRPERQRRAVGREAGPGCRRASAGWCVLDPRPGHAAKRLPAAPFIRTSAS